MSAENATTDTIAGSTGCITANEYRQKCCCLPKKSASLAQKTFKCEPRFRAAGLLALYFAMALSLEEEAFRLTSTPVPRRRILYVGPARIMSLATASYTIMPVATQDLSLLPMILLAFDCVSETCFSISFSLACCGLERDWKSSADRSLNVEVVVDTSIDEFFWQYTIVSKSVANESCFFGTEVSVVNVLRL